MDGEAPETPVTVPLEDALDLHSFRPGETAAAVAAYVEAAAAAGFREVRLIHGRGIGVQRDDRAAGPRAFPARLSFADATPERGGWGATVARLAPPGQERRRPPRPRDRRRGPGGHRARRRGRDRRGLPPERSSSSSAATRTPARSGSSIRRPSSSRRTTRVFPRSARASCASRTRARARRSRTSTARSRTTASTCATTKPVGAIRPRDGFFLVETPTATYRAKTCAIAIGILGRPQKPDWPIPPPAQGEDHVRRHVRSRSGTRTSSSWAAATPPPSTSQYLVQEGCRVVLSYRGDSFHRMNDINRDSLESLEDAGPARSSSPASNVAHVESDEGRPRVLFARGQADARDVRPRRPRARRHDARELPQDDRHRFRRRRRPSSGRLRDVDSRPLPRRRPDRGKDGRLDRRARSTPRTTRCARSARGISTARSRRAAARPEPRYCTGFR